jgi:hypothetical protein
VAEKTTKTYENVMAFMMKQEKEILDLYFRNEGLNYFSNSAYVSPISSMRFISAKSFYIWLQKNYKTFWIGDIIEAREMDQIFL